MRDGATGHMSVCSYHCFSAMDYEVCKLDASRNSLRLAALAGAFAALCAVVAAANAACPPAPAPVASNGGAPVHLERDSESCRVFSSRYSYDAKTGTYGGLVWHEETPAEIQRLVEQGNRVVFTDRLMAGSKMQVTEYLNPGLNHYFLAIPDEQEAIERGEAGPGWVRTGYGFTARTGTSSPLSAYVYRFYRPLWPGRNTYFITFDLQESFTLQRNSYATPADEPRWNYEGVPFNAFPVLFGGTCAASQVPVWRAYNGGPRRGVEPNHRFSTDKSVIDAMVSQGWIAEGIAFCVDAAA
jgi:hypothetical protein